MLMNEAAHAEALAVNRDLDELFAATGHVIRSHDGVLVCEPKSECICGTENGNHHPACVGRVTDPYDTFEMDSTQGESE